MTQRTHPVGAQPLPRAGAEPVQEYLHWCGCEWLWHPVWGYECTEDWPCDDCVLRLVDQYLER